MHDADGHATQLRPTGEGGDTVIDTAGSDHSTIGSRAMPHHKRDKALGVKSHGL